MAIKNFSIRIDEEMLHKLNIVADYEGRSANGEILIFIREVIMGWRKGKRKRLVLQELRKQRRKRNGYEIIVQKETAEQYGELYIVRLSLIHI